MAKTATVNLDPAAERAFVREFANIKATESDMAEMKGDLSAIYKRLESFGFTKEDIKWAKELEKKNASEVLATMQRRLQIAGVMGHQISRQMELFEKDRTPVEDRAYDEGLAAGKMRASATNPYGMETLSGQNWQKGFNEGTAFVNAALAEAVNGEVPLIKGGAEEGADEADEEADGEAAAGAAEDWEAAAPDPEYFEPMAIAKGKTKPSATIQ